MRKIYHNHIEKIHQEVIHHIDKTYQEVIHHKDKTYQEVINHIENLIPKVKQMRKKKKIRMKTQRPYKLVEKNL